MKWTCKFKAPGAIISAHLGALWNTTLLAPGSLSLVSIHVDDAQRIGLDIGALGAICVLSCMVQWTRSEYRFVHQIMADRRAELQMGP